MQHIQHRTSIGLEAIISDDITGPEPKSIFVEWSALDTDNGNGNVSAPARTEPIELKMVEFEAEIARLVKWIGEVKDNQDIHPNKAHGDTAELIVQPIPTGLSYKIEMGTLDVIMNWEATANSVTLEARQAYDITFERYIYFIDTLRDFIKAIKNF